jgi:hypothetical protein
VAGGADNDNITAMGGDGDDQVIVEGGAGNDKIAVNGDGGNDFVRIDGGAGDDAVTYNVSPGSDVIFIEGETGTNTLTVNGNKESFTVRDGNGAILHLEGTGGSAITVTNFQNIGYDEGASLTVALTGTGTVASSPPGIDCGDACSASYTTGAVVMSLLGVAEFS